MRKKENLSSKKINRGGYIVASKASYFMRATDNNCADTLVATDYKDPQLVCYRKRGHPQTAEQGQGWEETDVNDTLNIFDTGETRTPTLILENHKQPVKKVYDWHRQDTRMTELGDICVTATAGWGGGGNNMPYVLESENEMESIVRRLTPLECERLQGYPDGWTDIGEWIDSKGKKHKDADSPRYKALGNSIALPFWDWLAERITAQYDRPTTMASLFDGIGGFPLVFSRHGCEPIWASEIEEFPIAVTKIRFPESETIEK